MNVRFKREKTTVLSFKKSTEGKKNNNNEASITNESIIYELNAEVYNLRQSEEQSEEQSLTISHGE